jgi:dihydrodipicolinate synthase/N-acetylneuraminate lyase
MDYAVLAGRLRTVHAINVTPFREDGGVDYAPPERLRARAHSGYNVAVIKEAMNLLGLAPGRVRAPGSELNEKDRQELGRTLKTWGKLDEGSDTVP